MATPPKTHEAPKAGATGATGGAEGAAGDDPQKVDFDYDPEVKKQLTEAGSYKPTPEKTAEYIPPGPGPMAGGEGGSSGGLPKKDAKKDDKSEDKDSKSEAKK